jgi:two-component system, LytTR family, response regulator LytT
MNVLIIEDDLVVAQNMKEIIEGLGSNNVLIAKNDEEAFDAVNKVKPELFLADISLDNSKLDGISIMQKIGEFNDAPLIYTSALSDQNTRNRAKLTKPVAYLVKPFSARQLEVAIDFALHNKHDHHPDTYVEIDHQPLITETDYVYVKGKNEYIKIVKSDILYLKSDSSYTDIVTKTEKVRHYVHLKEIVARLKVSYIVRTHNSYAVNTRLIQKYDNETLYIYGHNELHSIPLGVTYKTEVMKWLPKL